LQSISQPLFKCLFSGFKTIHNYNLNYNNKKKFLEYSSQEAENASHKRKKEARVKKSESGEELSDKLKFVHLANGHDYDEEDDDLVVDIDDVEDDVILSTSDDSSDSKTSTSKNLRRGQQKNSTNSEYLIQRKVSANGCLNESVSKKRGLTGSSSSNEDDVRDCLESLIEKIVDQSDEYECMPDLSLDPKGEILQMVEPQSTDNKNASNNSKFFFKFAANAIGLAKVF
jgi:hypothetical protein